MIIVWIIIMAFYLISLFTFQVIREAFYKGKQIEEKSNSRDLVTETDKAVEEMVIADFKKAFPSHKLVIPSKLAMIIVNLLVIGE